MIEEIIIPELEEYLNTSWESHKAWSFKEIAQIERYYGKVPTKELAKIMKRTVSSIQCKASLLGIKYDER